MVQIRKATIHDLDAIKAIADRNKNFIGFVLRPALLENIERGWVIVAENSDGAVGFISYRHRKDRQTTLYEICVDEKQRRKSIGRSMLDFLVAESRKNGIFGIKLKCVGENPANGFFQEYGFKLLAKENGKRRKLNLWMLELTEEG